MPFLANGNDQAKLDFEVGKLIATTALCKSFCEYMYSQTLVTAQGELEGNIIIIYSYFE